MKLGGTTGAFLFWFKNSELSGLTFKGKILFADNAGFPN